MPVIFRHMQVTQQRSWNNCLIAKAPTYCIDAIVQFLPTHSFFHVTKHINLNTLSARHQVDTRNSDRANWL